MRHWLTLVCYSLRFDAGILYDHNLYEEFYVGIGRVSEDFSVYLHPLPGLDESLDPDLQVFMFGAKKTKEREMKELGFLDRRREFLGALRKTQFESALRDISRKSASGSANQEDSDSSSSANEGDGDSSDLSYNTTITSYTAESDIDNEY